METSQEIVKKAGIVPDLQLATKVDGVVRGTGPHSVKFVSDKIVMGTEYETGKERHEVQYIVEENGEKKKYQVPVKDKNNEVHYLVQRFAELSAGEEVILEYKRKGVKGYIEVKRMGQEDGIDKTFGGPYNGKTKEESQPKQPSEDISEEEINIPF